MKTIEIKSKEVRENGTIIFDNDQHKMFGFQRKPILLTATPLVKNSNIYKVVNTVKTSNNMNINIVETFAINLTK